jgi:hypothetical protein
MVMRLQQKPQRQQVQPNAPMQAEHLLRHRCVDFFYLLDRRISGVLCLLVSWIKKIKNLKFLMASILVLEHKRLARRTDMELMITLLEVLDHIGFPQRWRDWISVMLGTASTKVLVNGRPGRRICHAHSLR